MENSVTSTEIYRDNRVTRQDPKMKHKMQAKRKRKEKPRKPTCPPTTAMAGSESQSVGNELPSPWSPRAVHALWSLFTSDIKFSIPPPLPLRLFTPHLGSEIRSAGTDSREGSRTARRSEGERRGRLGEENREWERAGSGVPPRKKTTQVRVPPRYELFPFQKRGGAGRLSSKGKTGFRPGGDLSRPKHALTAPPAADPIPPWSPTLFSPTGHSPSTPRSGDLTALNYHSSNPQGEGSLSPSTPPNVILPPQTTSREIQIQRESRPEGLSGT